MKHFLLLIMCASITSTHLFAQTPTAEESNPKRTKYMQGYPPPTDKRINARDGSFFEFPALRYSVCHLREFMPTICV